MKEIILKDIVKSYDGNKNILDHLNLNIESEQRLILLGPSGCGKSTTLRLIAGLESITSGELYIGGKLVNNVPPKSRNISMVFQNYALYPHMSVKENIIYGLKVNKVPKNIMEERQKEAMEILKLTGLEDRKPRDLSGGQRQRVALARAIVKNTPYFLLDEPLSNLDAQLRQHARQELVKLHERYKMTFIYVTHDQVEAMTMGQKIVLLNKGRIQMVGTPDEIYHNPANVFTAKFIGSPSMNIINGEYANDKFHFKNDERVFKLGENLKQIIEKHDTNELLLGIRPEEIEISEEEDSIPITVKNTENYGYKKGLYFDLGNKEHILLTSRKDIVKGDNISIKIPENKIIFFDIKTEESIM